MHRPVWKAVALTATALVLAACGSDSTGPSFSKLTDAERASLLSAFTKLDDSLSNTAGASDVATGLQGILIALGSNSDVGVTTISAASLRRVVGNVSAIAENTTLSGSFRVVGFRAATDTGSAGDSLVTTGLVAWQDSSVVIFALKDGDAPETIDGVDGRIGIFVAPMSAWYVSAGSLTASQTALGGECTHNPAADFGVPATCHYNTMSVGLDMTGTEIAPFEGNQASGSLTGRIAPMTVPGVSFVISQFSGRRASLFAATAR
ncbi:MAG TPA: hypothetical protein VFS44_13535 [Gemmatimonadaceae bacterium]|nr:hypothetical protein [Gemmatimonadaceae bacterium]